MIAIEIETEIGTGTTGLPKETCAITAGKKDTGKSAYSLLILNYSSLLLFFLFDEMNR